MVTRDSFFILERGLGGEENLGGWGRVIKNTPSSIEMQMATSFLSDKLRRSRFELRSTVSAANGKKQDKQLWHNSCTNVFD